MTPKLSQFLQDNIAQAVVIASPPDCPPEFTETLHRTITLIAESAYLEGYEAGMNDTKAMALASIESAIAKVMA